MSDDKPKVLAFHPRPKRFTADDLLRELESSGRMDELIELGKQIRWA